MTTYTYPGVYIEEIKSPVHTITGVATSITAFVGYTARGIDHRARRIFGFPDFEREFGGLASDSELSYAVQHFFQNGGADAYVVRVPRHESAPASVTLLDDVGGGGKEALKVFARSNGTWSDNLIIDVDYDNTPAADPKAFNLTVTDLSTDTVETFANVTLDNTKSNFVVAVVNDEDSGSRLVCVEAPDNTADRPAATGITGGDITFGDIKNDKTYTIKLTSDAPAKTIEFTFIAEKESIPTSIAGVCRLLERKANQALQLPTGLPGARLHCTPNSSGKGLRVSLLIPDAYDAQLTFAAGATNDADAFLKLGTGNAQANVSHYWPNSQQADVLAQKAATRGSDGSGLPTGTDLIGNPGDFTGIYALDKVDLFNLLCLPDLTRAKPGSSPAVSALSHDDQNAAYSDAMTYCEERRAFLLVDPPPEVADVPSATDWKTAGLTVHARNGAAYFPRLKLPDPLNNNQPRVFAPSGVVAGLYARIDASRGVWKAPAGTEATLTGVQGVVYKLTDPENGALNPLGLNCFRVFPIYGPVCWGARTLVGADAEGNEWKYVPVRRMALFLEESLYRGTQWVVFEPNDEPLWSQIRLNLTAFMTSLFRQGAFQGAKPSEAFFVKCDRETTTQDDINKGIVNILVGFAPLKPAEFVVIKISQIAGQVV